MDLLEFFRKGGPIMWPLLAASVTALTVVIERFGFAFIELRRRDDRAVEGVLGLVRAGKIEEAALLGKTSKDPAAKILGHGLDHGEESISDALLHAASHELQRYERGLPILDTIITLSPLLGLLGTVTGLIQAFGLLGAQELGTPTAITGGIAEALIATAFGLAIAITALIPFNSLNSMLEKARYRFESAATRLELLVRKTSGYETV